MLIDHLQQSWQIVRQCFWAWRHVFSYREAEISRIYNFLWHIKNNFLDELTEAGLCSSSDDLIFAFGWSGNL